MYRTEHIRERLFLNSDACIVAPMGPDYTPDRSPAAGPARLHHPAVWITLVLAGIAIRIPHLTQSLWYDEVWRTHVMLRAENLHAMLLQDVHNPLYNAFMYLWISIAGDSEIAIRLPSLCFGLVSILVLHAWIRERFGAAESRIASGLMLLSPVHAWYSCEAKNNMLIMMLGVLVVVATDRLLRRWRWSDALRLCAWSVLAFLTSWQAAFVVLPAFAAAAAMARRSNRNASSDVDMSPRPKLLLAAALGTLLLLSPLLIFKAARLDELARWYPKDFHAQEMLRLLFIWFPTGNALVLIRDSTWIWWVLAFSTVVGPALWLGVRFLRQSSSGTLIVACLALPLASLLLITAACELLGLRAPRVYQERNMLVVFPWFVATAAVGAARCSTLRPCLPFAILALTLASSAAAFTWRAGKSTVMNPNPDWRAAAQYIRATSQSAPSPPVVISCCPLLPLAYYHAPGVHLQLPVGDGLEEKIATLRREHPHAEVFLINNPYWYGMKVQSLPMFEATLGHYDRADFRSLQVIRLPALESVN